MPQSYNPHTFVKQTNQKLVTLWIVSMCSVGIQLLRWKLEGVGRSIKMQTSDKRGEGDLYQCERSYNFFKI